MYKKVFLTIVALCLVTAIFIIPVQASNIKIEIDGQPVVFIKQQPVIINENILVPLEVFEQLGFEVDYNTNQVTLNSVNHEIVFIIGHSSRSFFTVNGRHIPLEVPAQIIEGSIMIPLRAVIERVGLQLDWNNNTISISTERTASYNEHELVGVLVIVSNLGDQLHVFGENTYEIEFLSNGLLIIIERTLDNRGSLLDWFDRRGVWSSDETGIFTVEIDKGVYDFTYDIQGEILVITDSNENSGIYKFNDLSRLLRETPITDSHELIDTWELVLGSSHPFNNHEIMCFLYSNGIMIVTTDEGILGIVTGVGPGYFSLRYDKIFHIVFRYAIVGDILIVISPVAFPATYRRVN